MLFVSFIKNIYVCISIFQVPKTSGSKCVSSYLKLSREFKCANYALCRPKFLVPLIIFLQIVSSWEGLFCDQRGFRLYLTLSPAAIKYYFLYNFSHLFKTYIFNSFYLYTSWHLKQKYLYIAKLFAVEVAALSSCKF